MNQSYRRKLRAQDGITHLIFFAAMQLIGQPAGWQCPVIDCGFSNRSWKTVQTHCAVVHSGHNWHCHVQSCSSSHDNVAQVRVQSVAELLLMVCISLQRI